MKAARSQGAPHARNPYEAGTAEYDLHEAADRLESEAKDSNEAINATDRRTAALYRVGAGLIHALYAVADDRAKYSIAEDIGMDLSKIADAISEIATAIKTSTPPASDKKR